MIKIENKISPIDVLKIDIQKTVTLEVLIKLILLPTISIIMSYVFVMKFNATEFYLQSNTFKQGFIIFGVFIALFLPFLITVIMHSKYTLKRRLKIIKTNSKIPINLKVFSKITLSLLLIFISLLVLLVLISGQVSFLYIFRGLELSLDFEVLKKLSYYLLLLPILILPLITLIAVIQNNTQNIIFTFIFPIAASFGGNVLVIYDNEFIIFSSLSAPMTILKPMFSTSTFDIFNFIIVIGVCIASIIMFSSLIVRRGGKVIRK